MNLLKKKPVYLWKSMKAGMKSANGNVDWKLGEWQKLEGTLDICNNGFHASEKPLDAMGYVNCEIMAKVEVRGKSIKQEDKQAWTEMRIVKAYEWKKEDSVALSIFAAELCIKNFEKVYPDDKRPREAIEAAKEWLKNPSATAESAARSAARSAAWSAESAENRTKCNDFVLNWRVPSSPARSVSILLDLEV
jgi:hypothetical protein